MGCLGDNEDVSDGHFLELVYRCLWFLGHCCKYVMFHGEWPGLTNVLTAQNAEQARMPNAKTPRMPNVYFGWYADCDQMSKVQKL